MDEERPENLGLSQLSFRYLGHDIKYLKYNWVQNNIVTKEHTLRNRSIENFKPFDQNTLLTKEQGEGTSKIFKNKLFIILMTYKFFRYGVLVFYKIYRKFIIKAKFY